MTELAPKQRTMMRATVAAVEPLDVTDDPDNAAALVRVGYAQWYPPLLPISRAAAPTFTHDRTQITPTGRAQDWVQRYGPGSDV